MKQPHQLRSEDKQTDDNGSYRNGKNRSSSRIFSAASSVAILAVGRDIDEMLERSVDEFAGDDQRHNDGERDPAECVDSEEDAHNRGENRRAYMDAEVALLGEGDADAVERMVKGFDHAAGFGCLALPAKRNDTVFSDDVEIGLECD